MAIFEDVKGQAQVVSTSGASHTESSGNTTHWSHNGQDKSLNSDFSTTQSVHDDGHGHRIETLTKVSTTHAYDKNTHASTVDTVSQSVSKELAPGQAPVDLSKALDEHSNGSTIPGLTYQNEHQHTDATASVTHTKSEVASWDKVGNKHVSSGEGFSSSGEGFSSNSSHTSARGYSSSDSGHVSVSGGLSDRHATGENSMSRAMDVGISSTFSEAGSAASYSRGMSMQSGVSHSDSFGSSVSQGHTHNSGSSQNVQHSAGLSAHVNDSLVNHLVKNGYSAGEAQETVHGVSQTLGQEINGHAMGKAGSVEFHKEGPVAVSLSSENSASTGNTVSVSMDNLKRVHESGMAQSLDNSQTHSQQVAQSAQASHELSR